MNSKRALQLALNFLKPFQEAGNVYNDYIEDEGINDDDYEEMLDVLRKLLESSKP